MLEPPIDYMTARERRMLAVLRAAEILTAIVRPVLAIIFGAATVYLAVIGTITSGEFLTVAAVVILYFFKARDDERSQERLQSQHEEMVQLAKQLPPPPNPEGPGGGR